ncbi:hypothetical protein [uncultured Clostridium sp.]|uniref:hypothetical protein n=1 Tax=uncultured Clostridium sp. TaxID=59620 RepID=UPI0028EE5183|nr:hypothetical protein [uncultured Clostridium sp.]
MIKGIKTFTAKPLDAEVIKKQLNDSKKQLTVKDIREFIEDLPDDMKVFIVSDDDMPIRKLVDITSEVRTGYYSELYLDTVEC